MEDNIKADFKVVTYEVVNWIDVVKKRGIFREDSE